MVESAPVPPTGSRSSDEPSRYWVVPVARAVVALGIGFAITFASDHSPALGLLMFGGFALISGLVLLTVGLSRLEAGAMRSIFTVQGIVTAIAGVVGFVLAGVQPTLSAFLFLAIVWAAVTGFLEMYSGMRARGSATVPASVGRDWLTVGAFTAVLSVAYLLMTPNAVVSVGVFGAYAVIVGVFLAIAGVSLKWSIGARAGLPTITSHTLDKP